MRHMPVTAHAVPEDPWVLRLTTLASSSGIRKKLSLACQRPEALTCNRQPCATLSRIRERSFREIQPRQRPRVIFLPASRRDGFFSRVPARQIQLTGLHSCFVDSSGRLIVNSRWDVIQGKDQWPRITNMGRKDTRWQAIPGIFSSEMAQTVVSGVKWEMVSERNCVASS